MATTSITRGDVPHEKHATITNPQPELCAATQRPHVHVHSVRVLPQTLDGRSSPVRFMPGHLFQGFQCLHRVSQLVRPLVRALTVLFQPLAAVRSTAEGTASLRELGRGRPVRPCMPCCELPGVRLSPAVRRSLTRHSVAPLLRAVRRPEGRWRRSSAALGGLRRGFGTIADRLTTVVLCA